MDARKAKYKCGEHVHNSELKALKKVAQVRYLESYLWLDIYCSSVTALAYDLENPDFIRAARWYKAFGYIHVGLNSLLEDFCLSQGDRLLPIGNDEYRLYSHVYNRRIFPILERLSL